MKSEHRRRVAAAYRGWSASYDRLMRRTYHRVERAITRDHLLGLLPEAPGGLLLDAGGGDGAHSFPLLREGRAARGVLLDLSPEMLDLARRRVSRREAPVALVRGDVGELPFPDGTFDVSLCLGGVLSHCPDHGRALDELMRVTRPGGRLAVSVDNLAVGIRTACRARDPAALAALLERGAAPVFHHPSFPFEVRFFTPEELGRELVSRGAEVLSLIGKPVFTQFLAPREVLSGPEVAPRVELERPFLGDPRFLPFADQLEAVARIP